jgi:hypothetical protein
MIQRKKSDKQTNKQTNIIIKSYLIENRSIGTMLTLISTKLKSNCVEKN